jgi:hypothetical protein
MFIGIWTAKSQAAFAACGLINGTRHSGSHFGRLLFWVVEHDCQSFRLWVLSKILNSLSSVFCISYTLMVAARN